MSKPKIMGLFRPWNDLEVTNDTSEIDSTLRVSNNKQEDDELVVSSTTSTLTGITEASNDYDSNILDEAIAASTSLNDCPRKRIRESESCNDTTKKTAATLKSEKKAFSIVQDAKHNSRAFHLPKSIPTRNSSESHDSSVISSNYLSTLRDFQTSEDLVSIIETYPMAISNSDIARSWTTNSNHPDISKINTHGIYSGIHSGFQPGIYPGILPLNFYNPSMEEAVQMVHRQDAVAKEIKKMRPKKHSCPHCSMAFSNGGQLTGHIRIHTGERPFKCDVESCGKRFTRNEELTRHKRIHTGVRPYSCVFCKKRFGRKDHLKKHMRTHEVRDSYRVSTAALGMIASLNYPFQQTAELSPYLYQI